MPHYLLFYYKLLLLQHGYQSGFILFYPPPFPPPLVSPSIKACLSKINEMVIIEHLYIIIISNNGYIMNIIWIPWLMV